LIEHSQHGELQPDLCRRRYGASASARDGGQCTDDLAKIKGRAGYENKRDGEDTKFIPRL